MERSPKIVVVMPAYDAARTLEHTLSDMPAGGVGKVILTDDFSCEETTAITRRLGLRVRGHTMNKGYGANKKACYANALEAGADIVMMAHPD